MNQLDFRLKKLPGRGQEQSYSDIYRCCDRGRLLAACARAPITVMNDLTTPCPPELWMLQCAG